MKSSKPFVLTVLTVAFLSNAVAIAAHVDMDDPRRAVGRQDDVRIDAQLLQDTVASGSPISVTYQIHNLTHSPIALADKRCEASYEKDSQTVTVSIGAEVPVDGAMPRMSIIGPGERRTFTVAAVLRVAVPSVKTVYASYPRFVQIKVNLLRDLKPFQDLLQRQQQARVLMTDEQFMIWLNSNDTIFLNPIPVRYDPSKSSAVSAEASGRRMSF